MLEQMLPRLWYNDRRAEEGGRGSLGLWCTGGGAKEECSCIDAVALMEEPREGLHHQRRRERRCRR
jgi:hypothetical protein